MRSASLAWGQWLSERPEGRRCRLSSVCQSKVPGIGRSLRARVRSSARKSIRASRPVRLLLLHAAFALRPIRLLPLHAAFAHVPKPPRPPRAAASPPDLAPAGCRSPPSSKRCLAQASLSTGHHPRRIPCWSPPAPSCGSPAACRCSASLTASSQATRPPMPALARYGIGGDWRPSGTRLSAGRKDA
jgi:hypothetical protein